MKGWQLERQSEAIEAIAVASGAGGTAMEAEPVLLRYAGLDDALAALGPSLILLPKGGELLAIVRTTRRHLFALTPNGETERIPRDELRALLAREIEARVSPDADRALANIPNAGRARMPLIRELAGDATIGGIWIVRPPIEDARTLVREAGILPGSLTFAGSQLLQTLLLMASWWILGRIAFGSGPYAGLLLLWLLVSLTM
ncbi:MAG: hypothetical protein QOH21_2710, partial [Acidobacteriota bacterium]|nr:hypothetical protein [Acidobacteriota bacterium]